MSIPRAAAMAGVLLLLNHALSQSVRAGDGSLSYPETRRVEQVDDFHGTQVADPYRWLEQDVRESSDVAAWVEAQNAITFKFLEQIPERERIQQRLTELWDYEKFSAP